MPRVRTTSALSPLLIAAALLAGAPAALHAQPYGGWGGGGWGRGGWGGDPFGPYGADSRNSRTGSEPSKKVEVTTFRAADAGSALAQGPIVIAAVAPDGYDGSEDNVEPDAKLPVYEAAVVDQLAGHGYNTATSGAEGGQVAEVAVSHSVVQPEEAPHKPVSGAMSTTISNRGSGVGLALAVDLSKPKKAIIGTRLEVRIRDKATRRVLWEGHAEGVAREGEAGLDNTAVATRLATALFAKFPEGTEVAALQP